MSGRRSGKRPHPHSAGAAAAVLETSPFAEHLELSLTHTHTLSIYFLSLKLQLPSVQCTTEPYSLMFLWWKGRRHSSAPVTPLSDPGP